VGVTGVVKLGSSNTPMWGGVSEVARHATSEIPGQGSGARTVLAYR